MEVCFKRRSGCFVCDFDGVRRLHGVGNNFNLVIESRDNIIMKIVHICLAGPFTDGWNYQENMLTKYHHKLGYDVTVITSKWILDSKGNLVKTDRSTYFNENGVRVIRLEEKNHHDFHYKFRKYEGLKLAIEEAVPDILFVHGISFCDIKTITDYVKQHPTRLYVDNHADFSNSARNWLSKKVLHGLIWRHYAQMICPYVTKFYGVLPARVDFLVNIYGLPTDRCELLVMGADDERIEAASDPKIRSAIRTEYNIEDNDFLIVTGGKIDVFKRQTLLLMQAVKDIGAPKVKLLVFGSIAPELQHEVKRLADGKNVQYIGWVEAENTYAYFAAADLACFPGRHSVFWEQAAGQGIPLLLKDWPGTHHISFGENAQFLYTDGVDEMKDRLLNIIMDCSQYEKMQRDATRAAKYFSYAYIAKSCIDQQ